MKRLLLYIALAEIIFCLSFSSVGQPAVQTPATTNSLAITPELQKMLVNLQMSVEQLLPALSAFNSGVQLRTISAVAPRPLSQSGENLSSRASVNLTGPNLSSRVSVNFASSISVPTAPSATITPAASATITSADSAALPPAVGAPPSPTGVQIPFVNSGGISPGSLRSAQQTLVMLQVDLERILPAVAALNNEINLNGGMLTNQFAVPSNSTLQNQSQQNSSQIPGAR